MRGIRLRRTVVTAFPADGPGMLATLRAGATPRMVRRSTPRVGVRRPHDAIDPGVFAVSRVPAADRHVAAVPGTAPAPAAAAPAANCGCG